MPAVSTRIRSKPAACSTRTASRDGAREREVRAPRGERAREDPRAVDRVHADAIAEQRAARAPPRGVDEQQADAAPGMLEPEAADDLVDDARLAGAARAREADDGRRRAPAARLELAAQAVGSRGSPARPSPRAARSGAPPRAARSRRATRAKPRPSGRGWLAQSSSSQRIMPSRPRPRPSSGRKMRATPYGLELRRLGGGDRPAAATIHAHVSSPRRAQPIEQVAEELEMPALVGGDRHRMRVLLHGGLDDLVDRAVVAEVDRPPRPGPGAGAA